MRWTRVILIDWRRLIVTKMHSRRRRRRVYLWFRCGWCAHIDLWFVYFVSVWRAYYTFMCAQLLLLCSILLHLSCYSPSVLHTVGRCCFCLYQVINDQFVRSFYIRVHLCVCFGDDHQFSYCRLISFIFTNTICDTNSVIDKIHIDYFENNKYYGIYSGFEIRKSCIITNDFEKIEYESRDKAFLVVWKKLCVTVGRPIIKIYCLVPTNWKILFQARIEVA